MLRIPYALLIPVALFMALAPLGQASHLAEKLRMLSSGTLQRPIDIFDLVLHSTPLVLLLWKGVTDIRARRGRTTPPPAPRSRGRDRNPSA